MMEENTHLFYFLHAMNLITKVFIIRLMVILENILNRIFFVKNLITVFCSYLLKNHNGVSFFILN